VQPGEIIALASLIFTIFTFAAAILIRSRDMKISELREDKKVLEAKLELTRKTLETKQETIDEQHRQLDRLIITAEIQEKFFSGLPRHLPPASPSGDK
jgi:hypothetical protein